VDGGGGGKIKGNTTLTIPKSYNELATLISVTGVLLRCVVLCCCLWWCLLTLAFWHLLLVVAAARSIGCVGLPPYS
jgi:hypothetical protein